MKLKTICDFFEVDHLWADPSTSSPAQWTSDHALSITSNGCVVSPVTRTDGNTGFSRTAYNLKSGFLELNDPTSFIQLSILNGNFTAGISFQLPEDPILTESALIQLWTIEQQLWIGISSQDFVIKVRNSVGDLQTFYLDMPEFLWDGNWKYLFLTYTGGVLKVRFMTYIVAQVTLSILTSTTNNLIIGDYNQNAFTQDVYVSDLFWSNDYLEEIEQVIGYYCMRRGEMARASGAAVWAEVSRELSINPNTRIIKNEGYLNGHFTLVGPDAVLQDSKLSSASTVTPQIIDKDYALSTGSYLIFNKKVSYDTTYYYDVVQFMGGLPQPSTFNYSLAFTTGHPSVSNPGPAYGVGFLYYNLSGPRYSTNTITSGGTYYYHSTYALSESDLTNGKTLYYRLGVVPTHVYHIGYQDYNPRTLGGTYTDSGSLAYRQNSIQDAYLSLFLNRNGLNLSYSWIGGAQFIGYFKTKNDSFASSVCLYQYPFNKMVHNAISQNLYRVSGSSSTTSIFYTPSMGSTYNQYGNLNSYYQLKFGQSSISTTDQSGYADNEMKYVNRGVTSQLYSLGTDTATPRYLIVSFNMRQDRLARYSLLANMTSSAYTVGVTQPYAYTLHYNSRNGLYNPGTFDFGFRGYAELTLPIDYTITDNNTHRITLIIQNNHVFFFVDSSLVFKKRWNTIGYWPFTSTSNGWCVPEPGQITKSYIGQMSQGMRPTLERVSSYDRLLMNDYPEVVSGQTTLNNLPIKSKLAGSYGLADSDSVVMTTSDDQGNFSLQLPKVIARYDKKVIAIPYDTNDTDHVVVHNAYSVVDERKAPVDPVWVAETEPLGDKVSVFKRWNPKVLYIFQTATATTNSTISNVVNPGVLDGTVTSSNLNYSNATPYIPVLYSTSPASLRATATTNAPLNAPAQGCTIAFYLSPRYSAIIYSNTLIFHASASNSAPNAGASEIQFGSYNQGYFIAFHNSVGTLKQSTTNSLYNYASTNSNTAYSELFQSCVLILHNNSMTFYLNGIELATIVDANPIPTATRNYMSLFNQLGTTYPTNPYIYITNPMICDYAWSKEDVERHSNFVPIPDPKTGVLVEGGFNSDFAPFYQWLPHYHQPVKYASLMFDHTSEVGDDYSVSVGTSSTYRFSQEFKGTVAQDTALTTTPFIRTNAQPWTMMFSFKTTSTHSNRTLLSQFNQGLGVGDFNVVLLDTGHIRIYFNGLTYFVEPIFSYNVNQYHQVVMTYDGADHLQLYANGVWVSDLNASISLDGTYPLTIGASSDQLASSFLSAQTLISDVGFFDTAKDDDVIELYEHHQMKWNPYVGSVTK